MYGVGISSIIRSGASDFLLVKNCGGVFYLAKRIVRSGAVILSVLYRLNTSYLCSDTFHRVPQSKHLLTSSRCFWYFNSLLFSFLFFFFFWKIPQRRRDKGAIAASIYPFLWWSTFKVSRSRSPSRLQQLLDLSLMVVDERADPW